MGTHHANRLWLLAGVLITALLVAVTYFLMVSPTFAEADELATQTETARTQAVNLRKELVKLQNLKKDEKQLTATRDAYRDALPSGSGVPAFLRQLQADGSAVGVNVSGITVGTPEPIESVGGVWSIQIQLVADGTAAELNKFLQQLQGSAQKRAVLIEATTLESDDSGTSKDQRINLTVRAFVAPPLGSGAPAVTTD
jgi:type IV pilus assembly protein PilO